MNEIVYKHSDLHAIAMNKIDFFPINWNIFRSCLLYIFKQVNATAGYIHLGAH